MVETIGAGGKGAAAQGTDNSVFRLKYKNNNINKIYTTVNWGRDMFTKVVIVQVRYPGTRVGTVPGTPLLNDSAISCKKV